MSKLTVLFASLAFVGALSAAVADEPVKTAQPPYKPGRQIDDESVKVSKPPYKPGRQIDAVKTGKPPYKPGREVDESKAGERTSKN